MNYLVILLVLCSAIIHTYWNFVLKKAINKGADNLLLYWLSGITGVLLYFTVFITLFKKYSITLQGLLLAAACGLFLAGYVFFLSKSYQHADLSQVYPLAKITPPFTLVISIAYLNETIHLAGVIGTLLVVLGVYSIHLESFSHVLKPFLSLKHKGSLFALSAAIVSAGYGLFSKLGVKEMNPFLFVYVAFAFSALFYTPLALPRKSMIRSQFRKYKKEIVQIAFLDMFGYSLIVLALSLSQLSYVFALRQVSIIFSVLAGIFVFKEPCGKIRALASLLIVAGIVLMTVNF